MRRVIQFVGLLSMCLTAAKAHGAGGVIGVGVAGGRLVISNGMLDNVGYADRIFVEDDADGYPVATNISGFGVAYTWMVPGLNITGMATNSGLYLETIARPVKNSNPSKQRVLWYWNPATSAIEDAPSANHFLIYKGSSAAVSTFLTGTDSMAQAPLKIAAPLIFDMNFDNYGGLVRFGLHRLVPPPAGAYGFFARLTSDQYDPSDPFLVLLNYGQLTGQQMIAAALAVNASAADPVTLAGDFNGDNQVNAADYTVWRNGLGSLYTSGDYSDWKSHFGQGTGGLGSSASGSVPVPEPASFELAASCLLGLLAKITVRPARQPVRRHFQE